MITLERYLALEKTAQQAGFSQIQILDVRSDLTISRSAEIFYADWLDARNQADMKYLESISLRRILTSVFPQVQTLILFAWPYRFRAVEEQLRAGSFKIARYAWQIDYHLFLKDKIASLLTGFSKDFRVVTDSAPLMERYWARRSGIGFIGRNGLLINQKSGSYFLIAAAFLGEEIGFQSETTHLNSIDEDFGAYCKNCALCITACPTQALHGDGTLNAARCISWQTIEARSENAMQSPKNHRWIFGCDICQQVCPYNKGEQNFAQERFNFPNTVAPHLARGELDQVLSVKNTPFARRGLKKIRQNVAQLAVLFQNRFNNFFNPEKK